MTRKRTGTSTPSSLRTGTTTSGNGTRIVAFGTTTTWNNVVGTNRKAKTFKENRFASHRKADGCRPKERKQKEKERTKEKKKKKKRRTSRSTRPSTTTSKQEDKKQKEEEAAAQTSSEEDQQQESKSEDRIKGLGPKKQRKERSEEEEEEQSKAETGPKASESAAPFQDS